MGEYLRPDVYVEEISSGEKPIQAVSTSTGAFIGVTARGQVGVPTLVTSWSDFVKKFALGVDTPFLKNSHLPNAVYGFFQNGGARCYVVRVASDSATAGKVLLAPEGLEILASDPGAWCNNNIKVKVANGTDSAFNLTVYAKNEIVEVLEGLSNDKASANYFVDIINETSKFVRVDPATDKQLVVAESKALASGDDATISLADGDFTKGIQSLDLVSKVNLVAVPGKSESAVVKALLDYCTNRGDCFAIVDPKENATLEEIQTYRQSLVADNGALYYPWGKIVDPLGRNSKVLKNCPPSGHVMGVIARTDTTRGVYKAPAGEECVVRGFVDLATPIQKGDIDILNPLGINVILSKPNKGVVIWGARSLSSNPDKRYISDVRYDIMVRNSCYEGTQWAVFEPNGEILWSRLDTSLRSFLDTQWKSGALRGTSAEQAYYVKCDSELNDESAINSGKIIAEIGYAKQRPAEFVIIRIVQKTSE